MPEVGLAGSVEDVLVVGAGPAGLACAIGSAMLGMRVRVVDVAREGPVDKACGEGLLPDALAALERLGVRGITGGKFAGIRFLGCGKVAEARFAGATGLGVRRTELHRAMLARAAEVGVEVEWGVRLGAFEQVPGQFLVGADGLQSRVREWAGLEGKVTSRRVGLRQHFGVRPWSEFVEVYWADGVQAYVTPVGEEEVGVAFVSTSKIRSVLEGLEAFPTLKERLAGAATTSGPRGALTLTQRLRRVTKGNAALLGDSSGSVDAITGEGMALAFRQAEALVDAMAFGNLEGYEAAHRRTMRMARVVSGALLWMDRSTVVRRSAMSVLAAAPAVFSGLLGVHVGRDGSKDDGQTTPPRREWKDQTRLWAGRLVRRGVVNGADSRGS